ncbi:MAG: FtsX-like permease family protein [Firmicutes bacterium]|nr:FtsX-like permease family protein [Bacillota bacterium]
MIILKIALRNVLQNKRRSLLIGLTLFIISFMLLTSNAAMNGVENQVISGYVNYQSGHVAVLWSEMKDVNTSEPTRFTDSLIGYQQDNRGAKERSVERLLEFLAENEHQVTHAFPAILRPVRFSYGNHQDQLTVYGLTPESARYLQDAKTLEIVAGRLPDADNPGVTVSQRLSDEQGVQIGDRLNLRIASADNDVFIHEARVLGIYANGAGYENSYAFMDNSQARELFAVPEPFFDICRIYLGSAGNASDFAARLDAQLLTENETLRAEDYRQASPFYTNNSRNMKLMFNIFILFMLMVIALGVVSTVRMNLFQRLQEFGTLRAIGYSRWQSYSIIFAEMFLLTAITMAAALACTLVLVTIFGRTGIYVGSALPPMRWAANGSGRS